MSLDTPIGTFLRSWIENNDPGDEDPGVVPERHALVVFDFLSPRPAERVRWINLDGSIHVAGRCPSCNPGRCRCAGALHWQPVYGAIEYACESCDADEWETSPVPAHDECGVLT